MYICHNCRSRLSQADAWTRRYGSITIFKRPSTRRGDIISYRRLTHATGLSWLHSQGYSARHIPDLSTTKHHRQNRYHTSIVSQRSFGNAYSAACPESRRVAQAQNSRNRIGTKVQDWESRSLLRGSRNEDERAVLCPPDWDTGRRKLGYKWEMVTIATNHTRHRSTARDYDAIPSILSHVKTSLAESSLAEKLEPVRQRIRHLHGSQSRHFHTSLPRRRTQSAVVRNEPVLPEALLNSAKNVHTAQNVDRFSGIRAELKAWHIQHANDEANYRQVDFEQEFDPDEPRNDFVRLSTTGPAATKIAQSTGNQSVDDPSDIFMSSSDKDLDEAPSSTRFLAMGDLVELASTGSEREAVIAVFVRRVGNMAQFFTAQGRWTHREEKMIQYSIPNWSSRVDVEPLVKYMPDPEQVDNLQQLLDEAYLHDMSVPRRISAPLVQRMQQFYVESQKVYRQHAHALDNAHNILAHDTDLRYSSLTSVASTLLDIPIDKLPIAALWTTRSALTRAGYAFNFDIRSHRLTGDMQILPKQQVAKVKAVREWFRAWQDDLARVSMMTDSQRNRHRPAKGAQYMYNFVDKAKRIVKKSRKHRMPSRCVSVGPSTERYPITPRSDSVRIKTDEQFSTQDGAILQFMQDWSCSYQLESQPRLLSLPPLLLQHVGLYDDYGFNKSTGFLFLQELGTLLPYENRVTFDPYLLLPDSHGSGEMRKFMDSLIAMEHSHDLHDSMEHLRQDWGNLPVFCIDSEGSQEIDDGMSIESCGIGSDGREQYWVHVHIANPTAFFSKDHPLAKMAGRLTETVYAPERNQTMLPQWVTSNHFSLEKDRPCLTFSAKMNLDGSTLEHKITPGIVRNVFHLSHEEVAETLGIHKTSKATQVVMTVGGDPPPRPERKSRVADLTGHEIEQLKILRQLAQKRCGIRKASGGVFVDSDRPEAQVWQSWASPGLPLQRPYYLGSRTVEGDPIIRLNTSGISNWYTAVEDETKLLVQEMMLLGCEIGASWCAERHIPFIYRGSVRRPDAEDPDRFLHEVLEPAAMKSPTGEWPLHYAHQYVTTFGYTILTTEPLKHRLLGMTHYGKVTSPLRRYGDMIVHWQIGAALLEEARTGQSLTKRTEHDMDRSFLPFNKDDLETIMVGLQSRENLIMRAKRYSQEFWVHMLLFRAIHFGESPVPLPLAPIAPRAAVRNWRKRFHESTPLAHPSDQRYVLRVYIHSVPRSYGPYVSGMTMEFNTGAQMLRPEAVGLEAAQHGDVWEAQVEEVNVYVRGMMVWPTRLLERDGKRFD